MGLTVGTAAGLIIFCLVGLIPAFRFGSYAALFILRKATGRAVEPAPFARLFIVSIALIVIVIGAAFFALLGFMAGSILPF